MFDLDVLACPRLRRPIRLIAFIANPTVAKQILDHLRLDSTGPPTLPRRTGPADVAPHPHYDVADPV